MRSRSGYVRFAPRRTSATAGRAGTAANASQASSRLSSARSTRMSHHRRARPHLSSRVACLRSSGARSHSSRRRRKRRRPPHKRPRGRTPSARMRSRPWKQHSERFSRSCSACRSRKKPSRKGRRTAAACGQGGSVLSPIRGHGRRYAQLGGHMWRLHVARS